MSILDNPFAVLAFIMLMFTGGTLMVAKALDALFGTGGDDGEAL